MEYKMATLKSQMKKRRRTLTMKMRMNWMATMRKRTEIRRIQT